MGKNVVKDLGSFAVGVVCGIALTLFMIYVLLQSIAGIQLG